MRPGGVKERALVELEGRRHDIRDWTGLEVERLGAASSLLSFGLV